MGLWNRHVEGQNLCFQAPPFIEWLKPPSSFSSSSSSPFCLSENSTTMQCLPLLSWFMDTKPVKIEDVGVQKEGFGVKEEKMGQVTVALRIGLPNSTSEADQSDTHHENKKVLDLKEGVAMRKSFHGCSFNAESRFLDTNTCSDSCWADAVCLLHLQQNLQ